MTTLAENSNNDIFVDPATGNLAIVNGLAQCVQNCGAAMETMLGECVLALQTGMPYDATMWTTYLPKQFAAAGRVTLLTVQDVNAVESFVVSRQGDVGSYVAVIKTNFGPATIRGVIPNV